MHVNIDDIVAKNSQWSLELTIAGKSYQTVRPTESQLDSVRKICGPSPAGTEVKDALSRLLCDLMGSPDPCDWTLVQLTGAAAAILTYSGRFAVSHIRAVMAAVRADQSE
jgi:hypothetical protein